MPAPIRPAPSTPILRKFVGGNAGRAARALVELTHRQEQRADHRRGFLAEEDVGEMLALDRQGKIHRQLKALEHRGQDGFCRGVIVIGFAAIDGVGRWPDHHALRREDLARRQFELRVVPRRLGARVSLHPGLGESDGLIGRRDLLHETHFFRRGRADLVAFEQHLQRVRSSASGARRAGCRRRPGRAQP